MAVPIYECYADDQSVFFTSKRAASRFAHEPDGEGDWETHRHPSATQLLSDMHEKIERLDDAIGEAAWFLLNQLPMSDGRFDASKYDDEQRRINNWIVTNSPAVAETHRLKLLK